MVSGSSTATLVATKVLRPRGHCLNCQWWRHRIITTLHKTRIRPNQGFAISHIQQNKTTPSFCICIGVGVILPWKRDPPNSFIFLLFTSSYILSPQLLLSFKRLLFCHHLPPCPPISASRIPLAQTRHTRNNFAAALTALHHCTANSMPQ